MKRLRVAMAGVMLVSSWVAMPDDAAAQADEIVACVSQCNGWRRIVEPQQICRRFENELV